MYAISLEFYCFLVYLNTNNMGFVVALSTMTWIYVCALERTQTPMIYYLEQKTYQCYGHIWIL